MSGNKNNRSGGGKHPNSPRYSDRYGKGHVNPYLGGQPKRDTLLHEIQERQDAVRRENEREAARLILEEQPQLSAPEVQPEVEADNHSVSRAAQSTARKTVREIVAQPKAMNDPELRERLRRIQEQAMMEAKAYRESIGDFGTDFDDGDVTPDVKLRLSEDNKPLIALESYGSDGRLEVKWIPVVLTEEEMEAFFPAIEPIQDIRGINLEEKKENIPAEEDIVKEDIVAEDAAPPDEDELILIPIAGLDDESSDEASAAQPPVAVVELIEAEEEGEPKVAGSSVLDDLPVIPIVELDVPDEEDAGEPSEEEVSRPDEAPGEESTAAEESDEDTGDNEDTPSDTAPEEEQAADERDEEVSEQEIPQENDKDNADNSEYDGDNTEEEPSEPQEEQNENDNNGVEAEVEENANAEADKEAEQPETELVEESVPAARRTAVAARPLYDELDANDRYAQSRYSGKDHGQDDTLFLRKRRSEGMALSVLADARLPKYIDDDDFVERWLGEGEEEDMASESKRRRRRISTIIGAVTMVLALIGFIAVARWGISLLSGIGNTDSQKSEYADFISPVVMSEVPVFEAWDAIPQDKLLQSSIFSVLLEMDVSYERDDTGKFIIPSTDIVDEVKELYGAYSDDPTQDEEINTKIRNALYSAAGEDTTNTDVYYVDMEDSFHVADGLSGPSPQVTDVSRRDNTVTLVVQYLEDLETGSGAILYSRQYILTLVEDGYYVQAIREYSE